MFLATIVTRNEPEREMSLCIDIGNSWRIKVNGRGGDAIDFGGGGGGDAIDFGGGGGGDAIG